MEAVMLGALSKPQSKTKAIPMTMSRLDQSFLQTWTTAWTKKAASLEVA